MITYRGWKIEKTESTQVGHSLANSNSLKKRIGIGTKRKVSGYLVHYPEGGSRHCDTLKEAKAYIDNYLA